MPSGWTSHHTGGVAPNLNPDEVRRTGPQTPPPTRPAGSRPAVAAADAPPSGRPERVALSAAQPGRGALSPASHGPGPNEEAAAPSRTFRLRTAPGPGFDWRTDTRPRPLGRSFGVMTAAVSFGCLLTLPAFGHPSVLLPCPLRSVSSNPGVGPDRFSRSLPPAPASPGPAPAATEPPSSDAEGALGPSAADPSQHSQAGRRALGAPGSPPAAPGKNLASGRGGLCMTAAFRIRCGVCTHQHIRGVGQFRRPGGGPLLVRQVPVPQDQAGEDYRGGGQRRCFGEGAAQSDLHPAQRTAHPVVGAG